MKWEIVTSISAIVVLKQSKQIGKIILNKKMEDLLSIWAMQKWGWAGKSQVAFDGAFLKYSIQAKSVSLCKKHIELI